MFHGSLELETSILGPRLKIIISSNILPESQRNELKYSVKTGFMFLSIILKWQVANLSIKLVIRKKVTVLDGPWSATQQTARQVRENAIVSLRSLRKRNFHNILCTFYIIDSIIL